METLLLHYVFVAHFKINVKLKPLLKPLSDGLSHRYGRTMRQKIC